MFISSSDELDYGSDTTISEDWEAIYHPAACKCGDHHNVTTGHKEDSAMNSGHLPTVDGDLILFPMRKHVIEHMQKPGAWESAADELLVPIQEIKMEDIKSVSAKFPASFVVSKNMASQLKVNSGGRGEFLRKPTTKNFAKPSHLGTFSSSSSTYTFHKPSARQPNGSLLVPRSSHDDIDTNMQPIKLFINRTGDPMGESSVSSTFQNGVVASPASNGGNHVLKPKSSLLTKTKSAIIGMIPTPVSTRILRARPAKSIASTPIATAFVNARPASLLDIADSTAFKRAGELQPSGENQNLDSPSKAQIGLKTPSPPRIKWVVKQSSKIEAFLAAPKFGAVEKKNAIPTCPLSKHQVSNSFEIANIKVASQADLEPLQSTTTRALKRKASSYSTEPDNLESTVSLQPATTALAKKRKSAPDANESANPKNNTSQTTIARPSKKVKATPKTVESIDTKTATKNRCSAPAVSRSTKRKTSTESEIENLANKGIDSTTKMDPTDGPPPAKRARKLQPIIDHDESENEHGSEFETIAAAEPQETITNKLSGRATRGAARRFGGEAADFVELESNTNSSRRKSLYSWADPKSPDWDVIRFLNDDSMLAKDNLLRLPPKNHTYVTAEGKLREPIKFNEAKPAKAPHPKLVYHEKNGTDTPSLRHYYQEMPRDQIIPIAGMIDIPETGSGWKPDVGHKGRRPKSKANTNARSPVVRNLADDSSSSSSGQDEGASPQADPKKYAELLGILTVASIKFLKLSQEDSFQARPMVQLPVPDHIKAILVDDWENVTKNQQLVPLPAKYPVNAILNDYLEYEMGRRQGGTPGADLLPEVISGLKEYFEKCLGRVLLYRFERSQYQEVREGFNAGGDFAGKTVCDTYGAEHLCRLIVTLPELIAQTNMDAQSVNRLREELTKLTIWLGRNVTKYFVNEYETPGAEYIEKARSG